MFSSIRQGFDQKKLIIKTKINVTSGTTDVFGNSLKFTVKPGT